MNLELWNIPRNQKRDFRFVSNEIATNHYLKTMPDPRTSFEIYQVFNRLGSISKSDVVGYLTFGRPEATRCYPWYGSFKDVIDGKAEVTRWQVLNLSRVWIYPKYQKGGEGYDAAFLPGFVDRFGNFQSTLASDAIKQSIKEIGFDYLSHRPPVFLEEPYEIAYLLSYCNTSLHRGTIYQKSGFELFRTNDDGIQTWRIPLPALTQDQRDLIEEISRMDHRARKYRVAQYHRINQPILFSSN